MTAAAEIGLLLTLASAVSVAATVLWQRPQRRRLQQLQQQQLLDQQQLQRLQPLESRSTLQQQQLAELQAQLAAAHSNRQLLQQQLRDKEHRLEQQSHELLALATERQELATTLSEKQQHFQQQLQLLEHNKAQLANQFEQLAAEILERKGQAFNAMNKEAMSHILTPIHAELKGFKDKVETIHNQETEQRTKLRTELENLQKLNQAITAQADKLTTALQGQKKVQGNWGELMLENVLDNAGLRLGKDYQREVSFTTEEGRLRPDAIVYLPQGKHLVVDAKTSLNAYTRFVNADDELERATALKQHAAAVQDRINELASKRYSKLPGLNSPEVVIMFIPVESAYVEALKADDTLFQRALEQHILVATPTTLLTSLNIVRQLWRLEDQSKHSAELANRAEKFYSKLNAFLVSMEQVGKQLDSARISYDKALGQLYSGRGNLIKQASEFKELGVAVQKELSPALVDKANLELEHLPELPSHSNVSQ
ncbi:DNA recombination protein RmuC [Ferrimonas senticii]|uniref:DNA recombination protein RmuC n=1 Tax=Ferrimonas senticii TaxID=394566 RepID=UPI0004183030|nr:DNA recombination protein RmuC [Ferrimonas senticii]